MRLFEFGKGNSVQGLDYPTLYHLCEYHAFSYAIENNKILSHGSYVSTTWDATMNHIVGKPHTYFKIVLNGTKLIDQFGGFHYDDSALEIGGERRRRVSHNEREIGIGTREVKPLNEFHKGTVLLFDLFTEGGLQWLLYRNPGQKSGFMSTEISPTGRAIDTLYYHLFNLKKPVWKMKVGNNFDARDIAFLKQVYRVARLDLPFAKSLEMLADAFPIRDHWNKQVDKQMLVRRHMAPKFVHLINNYFQDKPYAEVDADEVKSLIEKCIKEIDLGNNANAIIFNALNESGLYHATTEAVTWGGILKSCMDGDIDEILSDIAFFTKRALPRIEFLDRMGYEHSRHAGTDFGRGASANW